MIPHQPDSYGVIDITQDGRVQHRTVRVGRSWYGNHFICPLDHFVLNSVYAGNILDHPIVVADLYLRQLPSP